MSTNGDNITEDAEMAECDGDKVVTMMDVLQEQQEFEEDANAVLGASDDKNCTYSKGYIKRQAIYACLTCCTEAKEDPTKRAGVCLACSLTCHENHELVELYTKRNFRCDCGNPKFNTHPCQFIPVKTDFNEDNSYNQNFSGLYCVCHRPYPDPEATMEDDMIQCIICEDWLHSSHLEATVPSNELYAEMICKSCMEQNEFLHDYTSMAVNCETNDIDIVTVNGNDSISNGDLKEFTDSEITTEINEKLTNSTDIQIDGDQVDKIAEPSDNIETKSIEVTSEATNNDRNNSDIVMTDKVEKNVDKQSENENTDETVSNIDSTIKEQVEKEGSNTETIIAQPDILPGKTEDVVDDQNTKLNDEKQNTEHTVDKMLTEDIKPDEQKEDLAIDDKTEKSDGINVTTDNNVTYPKEDTNSLACSEKRIGMPEDSKEVENNEGHEKEITTPEPTIDEISHSKERATLQAENVMDNKESVIERIDKSADQQLPKISVEAEPTMNTEKTEDQQLLDDLNELTSDKQDLDEINVQQATNIEYKVEANNAQTIKESEHTEYDSDKSAKDHIVSENKNLKIEEPVEVSNFEAMETDTNKKEVTQSTKITESSQNVPTEKENNVTDSVMSAIDEILEGSSVTKSDNVEENVTITGELIADNSIVTDKLDDVDISNENKSTSHIPELIESEDKKVTEDIQMTDLNASQHMENNVAESANKDYGKESVENETLVDESKLSETTNKELNEIIDTTNMTKGSEIIEAKSGDDTLYNNIKEIPTTTETEEKSDYANIDGSMDIEKVSILSENTNENKRKCDTESEDMAVKKIKLDEDKSCIRPKNVKKVYKGATFWPSNFRQKLCTCGECISMYKDLNVLFLTDNEDTVTAYESLGKENVGISQYEKGLEALSSLDRIQQINALTEYNKMRDKLLDFLKSFKDRKEIVKEEDIKAFFAGMKPKREPDGVYFCR